MYFDAGRSRTDEMNEEKSQKGRRFFRRRKNEAEGEEDS